MPIQLFNTETRKKELFKPIQEPNVSMYTCGPTVYHYAHIGNFRTYVFEDLLRRTLKLFGYQVNQVMNITDVDDKTIKGAIETKQTLKAFTKPFEEAFFEDLKTLNIEPVEHNPHATDYIPDMIIMIEVLLEKGIAYKGNEGSIYYAIRKFPRYGCLSHLVLEELEAGRSNRVNQDEYDKEHASDFVLWKAYDESRDGNIFWESPFGPGRPGWHLECSAMAMKILGKTIDIHVGGVDNIFPHHENEIAQSEACSGKQFVNHWLHSEHLIVEGKKMSKSLGNFFTLRDLLDKGYSGREVRYMLLHTHYRSQLNFTIEGLEGIRHTLSRLDSFVQRMLHLEGGTSTKNVQPILDKGLSDFKAALADDLNISLALAALFDAVREINALADQQHVNQQEADQVLDFLKEIDAVLGVLSFQKEEETISPEILEMAKQRQEARLAKDWKKSDELRDEIAKRGYLIEDTPQGPRIKKS